MKCVFQELVLWALRFRHMTFGLQANINRIKWRAFSCTALGGNLYHSYMRRMRRPILITIFGKAGNQFLIFNMFLFAFWACVFSAHPVSGSAENEVAQITNGAKGTSKARHCTDFAMIACSTAGTCY